MVLGRLGSLPLPTSCGCQPSPTWASVTPISASVVTLPPPLPGIKYVLTSLLQGHTLLGLRPTWESRMISTQTLSLNYIFKGPFSKEGNIHRFREFECRHKNFQGTTTQHTTVLRKTGISSDSTMTILDCVSCCQQGVLSEGCGPLSTASWVSLRTQINPGDYILNNYLFKQRPLRKKPCAESKIKRFL